MSLNIQSKRVELLVLQLEASDQDSTQALAACSKL